MGIYGQSILFINEGIIDKLSAYGVKKTIKDYVKQNNFEAAWNVLHKEGYKLSDKERKEMEKLITEAEAKYREKHPESNVDKEQIAKDAVIIKKLVKKYVSEVNKDESVQAKLKAALEKMKKDDYDSEDMDGYDKKSGVPKLSYKIEDEDDEEITFVLYDGAQMMQAIVMSIAIDEVEKRLKDDPEFKKITTVKKTSTGDGDEGCLYIKFKK